MLKLGLTGSIATGKSTVLAVFAERDVPTFSSDEAVHELYRGAAVGPVEQLFPGVTKDGTVDRSELSKRLLAAPERLRDLEAVVHRLVRARIRQFLLDAEAAGAKLAVVDVPLLFENGVDWGFDAVAVTVVDEAIQRQRALARPGMTVEKLDAILARQMPQAEKQQRATYVFDTSGSLEQTRADVHRLIDRLTA